MGYLANQTETGAIDAEAVRQALDRALASPEFRLSARMSQLLRFLVETTLADRGGELKETVVGIEVFGRRPDYDPKIDPVVRKEARRLRLKLQEYYQGTGSAETTRIDLPKGGYVPAFGVFSPVSTPSEARAMPVELSTVAAGARHRTRLRWALPAGVAVMLLLGTLTALRVDSRKSILVPQPLTGNSGNERSPAFSPDGQQIAFAWDSEAGAEPSIYVQALRGNSPRRLTSGSAYENHPTWSPDGRNIAFVRRTASDSYAVCVHPFPDGADRILTEISAPDHVDWSPDGATIATSDAVPGSPSSIIFISAATGARRQITIPSPGAGDTFPRFSPDGRRMAFLRVAAVEAEVYLLDLKSPQTPKRLTYENRKIEGFTWAPDGRGLVASLARWATARSLWRIPVDGSAMERIAVAGTAAFNPVWSPQGSAMAFVQRRNDINLWRIRPDAPGAPAIVADSSALDSSPTFSPNGEQIAFRSSRSGTNEIWRTGLLQNTPSRLTWINGPLTGSPSWSPDGKWMAFDSRVAGNSDILLAPSTAGPWRNLTDAPSNEVVPRWSHDGQWIYFGSDRSGRWQIWKQRPSGGAAEQVTWRGGYVAAESPDAKHLYYTRARDEAGLYRVPVAGGEEELVLPGFAGKLWGNWAPAWDGIYYLHYPEHDGSTMSTIRYFDLRSNQSRDVYRLPKHPVLWDGGLALSPDGKWLVFAELDYSGSNIQLIESFR